MTTFSRPYQGDLLKVLTPDGSSVLFTGGDPERDVSNIQNAILYSLFVSDWFANVFATSTDQVLTGRFLEETNKTLTKVQILNIQDAAEKDLAWLVSNGTLSAIEVTVNIVNNNLQVIIKAASPGEDISDISLVRTAAGWSI